jgi:hypothetical protein
VKEQSHLEAMRAAVQGDRERAERARQRSFENVRPLVEPAVVEKQPAAPEPPRRSGLRRFLGFRR